ncbi:MAG: hypothetical protein PWP76_178 [Candidatus Diapherotrites archaeon]|nr:hypothetical protein [Candidatus Diapherotrites archaeon]MDN5367101.1 hypothetical protein [Candidatus Diapherotrites archaeon]
MYKRSKNVHPEAALVRREWTIRLLELPPEILSRRRQLLRWVALSLGLISPGDERDAVIDVLDAIFYYIHGKDVEPSVEQIHVFVNRRRQERGEKPVVMEAIRYHLRRLEAAGIIEKTKVRGGNYRFAKGFESSYADPAAFVESVFEQILSSKQLIEKAVRNLASLYK